MKAKLILSALLCFSFYLLSSQSPHGFNYQAVAMDAGGAVLVEQPLTARISILTASTGGTLIWEETHAVTTNKSGLISFVVGTGNRTGGSASGFSDISWSTLTLFLKTEIDPGSGYITMGTTQIWSVPYSMTAKNTETKQTLSLAGSDLSISGGNTVTLPSGSSLWTANGADIYRPGGNVGIGNILPAYKLDVSGGLRTERIFGVNSILLDDYQTVNPASNVLLTSSPDDRDSWIFRDVFASSNYGIYHRQINSDVKGLPWNSIGFIGGGGSTLQSYISLQNGSAFFNGNVGIGTPNPDYILDVVGRPRIRAGVGSAGIWFNNSDNSSLRGFAGMAEDDHIGLYGVGIGFGFVMNVNNGNIGIGTASNAFKLAVAGNISAASYSGVADINAYSFEVGGVPTSTNRQGTIIFHHHQGVAHQLRYTGGVLHLEAAGNGYGTTSTPGFLVGGGLYAAIYGGSVGIGTVNPDRLLTVKSSTSNTQIGKFADDARYIGLGRDEVGAFDLAGNPANLYLNRASVAINTLGNVGIGTLNPTGRLSVIPTPTWSDEVPLFEVKNKSGIPVFAVYNNGVRILVDDNSATKGIKGGFAIGGFDNTKATLTGNLVTISPDSIRFNINNAATKGVKGGFGIGSYGTVKGALNQDFMYITPQAGSSGLYNVTLGYLAGKNTTGAHNTLIGLKAGYGAAGNGSGGNIFIGEGAGMNNSGGYLTSNITLPDGTPIETITSWGGENVGIGLYCGKNLNGTISSRTGNYNVMVGNYSGTRLSTGYKNVLIGNYAGYKLETGHHNVFIGYDAGKEELGSNKLYIDNSSTAAPLIYGDFDINYVTVNGDFLITGSAYKPGGGSWSASSDVRLKDIHESFSLGLNEIVGLNPVYFNYKEGNARMHASDVEYVGFVAQDVQQLLPEAVSEGKDGYLNLDMHVINVALVNAVKEQQKQIETQNEKIVSLEKMVLEMKSLIEKNIRNEE